MDSKDGEGLGPFASERSEVRAETRAEMRAEMLERVLSFLPSIVYVHDLAERKDRYVNRSLAAELGYTKEQSEALGDSFSPRCCTQTTCRASPRPSPGCCRSKTARRFRWMGATRPRAATGAGPSRTRWCFAASPGTPREVLGFMVDIQAQGSSNSTRGTPRGSKRWASSRPPWRTDLDDSLAIISGFLGLHTRLDPKDHRRSYVEYSEDALRQAASLTRQILAFARPRAQAPESTELVRALRKLEPLLARLLPSSVVLRMRLPDRAMHAWIDPTGLEQVLLNLTANARDAMPDGGILEVSVHEYVEPTPAGYSAERGRFAAIEVHDTGTGIAPRS